MHTGTALLKVTASRIAALLALVVLVGLLPWLSGRGAEYTILRARYADREPTGPLAAAGDEAAEGADDLAGHALGFLR